MLLPFEYNWNETLACFEIFAVDSFQIADDD